MEIGYLLNNVFSITEFFLAESIGYFRKNKAINAVITEPTFMGFKQHCSFSISVHRGLTEMLP